MRRILAAFAASLIGTAEPVTALEISGEAVAIDGDTIAVGVEKVRLHGIDAPEAGQKCLDGVGRAYDCGRAATRALELLLAGATVSCGGEERDRYGRLVAVCRRDGREINREMVRAGWARAFVRYSDAYVADESAAAAAGRGLWAGHFQSPWDYRAAALPGVSSMTAAVAAAEGCTIKGNISANGRIYHTPASPNYAATRIDPARGERWFCSEAEATAAGWRPPRN